MASVARLKTYLLDECTNCNKKIPKLTFVFPENNEFEIAWFDHEAMINGRMDYYDMPKGGNLIHSCLISNKGNYDT
mgnify:CR=1 FL=1